MQFEDIFKEPDMVLSNLINEDGSVKILDADGNLIKPDSYKQGDYMLSQKNLDACGEEIQVKCCRPTNLTIVSSGYGDRFVYSETVFCIEHDGIKYRIDTEHDRISAVCKIAGLDWSQAAEIVRCSLVVSAITYKIGKSQRTIRTTAERLAAGIAIATGFPGLSGIGVEWALRDGAALTSDEWDAICAGLEAINQQRESEGRPSVAFTRGGF